MGGNGRMGRMDSVGATALMQILFSLPVFPATRAFPAPPAALEQPVPFEQAIADLSSADAGARIRALQLLRDGAFPEAAVPIAALVTDARDEVQLEAIAAELNIFLVEKIVTKKRVAG